jgi:hypothetical protein
MLNHAYLFIYSSINYSLTHSLALWLIIYSLTPVIRFLDGFDFRFTTRDYMGYLGEW